MHTKTFALLSMLLLTWITAVAQITVTNATFPVAGDSLRTATDLAPSGIIMTGPGGPQTWDFNGLNPDTRLVTPFQPASEGAAFASYPEAELVTIGDLGAEIYYDVSATAFSLLGISGADLGGGLPIPTDFKYSPPLVEREAPLNFFDINNVSTNATVALPTSAIPGGILDSLGIPTGLFDSIRVRLTIDRLEVVDGYGMLTIPGGTYEVLRQKRTDYTATGVDIHTFLGWVDVATIIGEGYFPADTTITFNFISNTAKEPIAVVTVDTSELNAVQVVYKDNGVPSAINPVTGETIAVVVSPNPVTDLVVFEMKNIAAGQYTLHLMDMNGKRVLVNELRSDHEVISLNALPGGLYLYQVIDIKDRMVCSGKLVKANR